MSPPNAKCDDITWEEKCRALANAFRSLKIQRPRKATGIPYESLVPDIGRQLMLMTPVPPGPKTVAGKKSLHDLVQSTGRTIQVLDRLPQSVLDALNYRQAALSELKTKLRILHAAAEAADVKTRHGAPQKAQPRKTARVVAQHYYALTGRKPTVPKKDGKAYGPFLELLRTVFEILGINKKASALSQAEEISRDWKSVVAEFPIVAHGER